MFDLRGWLTKMNTHPQIVKAIVDGLSAWRKDEPWNPSFTWRGVQSATDRQQRVGWQALLEGCPAIGWAEAQQLYFEWLEKRNTGRRWLVSVIQQLWNIAWDLWEHRNKILHDADDSDKYEILDHEITEQYQLGERGLTRQGK